MPGFLLLFTFIAFNLFTRRSRNHNDKLRIKVENIYHAHYTAGMIEDAIREIRRADYHLREKYAELTNGNSEESTQNEDTEEE